MLSVSCSVHWNVWLIGVCVNRKHRKLWGYFGPLVFEWHYRDRHQHIY